MSRNRLSYEYEPEFDPVDECRTEREMMRYYDCTLGGLERNTIIQHTVRRTMSEHMANRTSDTDERISMYCMSRYKDIGESMENELNALLRSKHCTSGEIHRLFGDNLPSDPIVLGKKYTQYGGSLKLIPIYDKILSAVEELHTYHKGQIQKKLDELMQEKMRLVQQLKDDERELRLDKTRYGLTSVDDACLQNEVRKTLEKYDTLTKIAYHNAILSSSSKFPTFMRRYIERYSITEMYEAIAKNADNCIDGTKWRYGLLTAMTVRLTIGANLETASLEERERHLNADKLIAWLMTVEYLSLTRGGFCRVNKAHGNLLKMYPDINAESCIDWLTINGEKFSVQPQDSKTLPIRNVPDTINRYVEQWVAGDIPNITIEFMLTRQVLDDIYCTSHRIQYGLTAHDVVMITQNFVESAGIDFTDNDDYAEYLDLIDQKDQYITADPQYQLNELRKHILVKEGLIRDKKALLNTLNTRIDAMLTSIQRKEIELTE